MGTQMKAGVNVLDYSCWALDCTILQLDEMFEN